MLRTSRTSGLALDNARQWTRDAPEALRFASAQQANDCAHAWGLSPFKVVPWKEGA
jgi:hypothetical protein